MKKELEEAERIGAEKEAIYQKYGKISAENRDKATALVQNGTPFDAIGVWEELNGGVDLADSLKWATIFADLSAEDQTQLTNFVKAENGQSAQAIYQSLPTTVKIALQGKEIAENAGVSGAVAGSGISALGIRGNATNDKGKGSAIPVPEKTSASNGLIYQSNGKHTPNQPGYSRESGTEPKNSIELFGNSIESGKKRYAIDKDGNVHQFTNTNDGSWHWSGSTGDKSVPLNKSQVPNSVRKEFGLPGKWR
ncbi:hypothetical protein [Arsenophonus apicola]|uniref:hypothetical protein n=1 Tax=Arsenophonus apicola TaxID=2879119 RepID=UPI00387A4CB2